MECHANEGAHVGGIALLQGCGGQRVVGIVTVLTVYRYYNLKIPYYYYIIRPLILERKE